MKKIPKEEKVKMYVRFKKPNHKFIKSEAKKMGVSQNQMVNILVDNARSAS